MMNRTKLLTALLLLGGSLLMPASAQDAAAPESAAPAEAPVVAETPAPSDASAPETAPAADAPPAEAAPADATAAEAAPAEAAPAETPPADTAGETPAAESAPAETASSETPSSEEAAPAAERTPWKLYVGFDQDRPTISFSDQAMMARFGDQQLDSSMLRLRAGVRLFGVLGVELHYGNGNEDGKSSGKFKVGSYAGLYFVPTGLLFDTVEIAGILGYTKLKVERGNVSESLTGEAYGVNVELPVRVLADFMPDLRVGGGYIIYNDSNNYRTYGAHFGLRFDFEL